MTTWANRTIVGVAEQLADGLLVVLDVALLEQHPLLEPAVEPALDDLRMACSGLPSARVMPSSVCALLVDLVGGHLVAGEVRAAW